MALSLILPFMDYVAAFILYILFLFTQKGKQITRFPNENNYRISGHDENIHKANRSLKSLLFLISKTFFDYNGLCIFQICNTYDSYSVLSR
jgi:hypothetical protein